MNKESKIMIAGARGMVGSAVLRYLRSQNYTNILPIGRENVDLTRQRPSLALIKRERPEYIIIAAAKVGGIMANNNFPAQFLYDNIMIQSNLIHGAYLYDVKKLLLIGSSCIYPKYAPQPITEEQLLTGSLEPTNEAYAIAKIAGIKMCDAYAKQYGANFISLMPCNLYGPGDNFHPENSHVIPGLIHKFHYAKLNSDPCVTCWGSGTPKREFMFVDDLASAILFALKNYDSIGPLNVGTGREISIKKLAETIARITGFSGQILWDSSKPDGTPRKVLNIDQLTRLGWSYRTSLKEGLTETYNWYVEHQNGVRH